MSILTYLINDGLLEEKAAAAALMHSENNKLNLISFLVNHLGISSLSIVQSLSKHFALPAISLDIKNYTPPDPLPLTAEFILKHRILPIAIINAQITIGVTDPSNQAIINTICFLTGLSIECVVVDELELEAILQHYFMPMRLQNQLAYAQASFTPEAGPSLTQEEYEEPISVYINQLLAEVISKRHSDLHIEPFADAYRLRFRRDGLLQIAGLLEPPLAKRLITRLKLLGELDIAESRLPQDGHIKLAAHPHTDIRLNSCPMLHGEKLVLRFIYTDQTQLMLNQLGLLPEQETMLKHYLQQPQGCIVVTGPTGSGKTFTLYSALHYLNTNEKNIATVENPVEVSLAGINQVNVNPGIGLTFANTLKTLLRQDPDILMVGEIREQETAVIALQAAQTGHLVLTTMHTHKASATLQRLRSLGITNDLEGNPINLVIAQRLIRKLCPHCKELYVHESLGELYRQAGCSHCHQGYLGRTGVFELLPSEQTSPPFGLYYAALEKARLGMTSLQEINRVLGHQSHV